MASRQGREQDQGSVKSPTYWRRVRTQKVHRQRAYHREYLYGLSNQEYSILLSVQRRRCAICRVVKHSHKVPLRVDHDHATGAIRGLLCRT